MNKAEETNKNNKAKALAMQYSRTLEEKLGKRQRRRGRKERVKERKARVGNLRFRKTLQHKNITQTIKAKQLIQQTIYFA